MVDHHSTTSDCPINDAIFGWKWKDWKVNNKGKSGPPFEITPKITPKTAVTAGSHGRNVCQEFFFCNPQHVRFSDRVDVQAFDVPVVDATVSAIPCHSPTVVQTDYI